MASERTRWIARADDCGIDRIATLNGDIVSSEGEETTESSAAVAALLSEIVTELVRILGSGHRAEDAEFLWVLPIRSPLKLLPFLRAAPSRIDRVEFEARVAEFIRSSGRTDCDGAAAHLHLWKRP